MFKKHIYPTTGSLKPVRDVLAEAADLCDEKFLTTWRLNLHPVAAGGLGAAAGVGVGKATLLVGAAAGTKGAAALTSGLAFAGSAVGAGMAVGIAMVAVPVAALGATAYGVVWHKQQKRLAAEKQALLAEAEGRQTLIKTLRAKWLRQDTELENRLHKSDVLLDSVIKHLRSDLGAKATVDLPTKT